MRHCVCMDTSLEKLAVNIREAAEMIGSGLHNSKLHSNKSALRDSTRSQAPHRCSALEGFPRGRPSCGDSRHTKQPSLKNKTPGANRGQKRNTHESKTIKPYFTAQRKPPSYSGHNPLDPCGTATRCSQHHEPGSLSLRPTEISCHRSTGSQYSPSRELPVILRGEVSSERRAVAQSCSNAHSISTSFSR